MTANVNMNVNMHISCYKFFYQVSFCSRKKVNMYIRHLYFYIVWLINFKDAEAIPGAPIACIGAGTGLGECFLTWENGMVNLCLCTPLRFEIFSRHYCSFFFCTR